MTFFRWLSRQTTRADAVGVFARFVVKDPIFPQQARHLYLFLLRYEHMPEQREGAKRAHAEWRRMRRDQV